MKDDFDFCEEVKCPHLFKRPDCTPGKCIHFNERMQMVGSIYMITPDDTAEFVAALPGKDRRDPANRTKTTDNKVEIPPYPPLP